MFLPHVTAFAQLFAEVLILGGLAAIWFACRPRGLFPFCRRACGFLDSITTGVVRFYFWGSEDDDLFLVVVGVVVPERFQQSASIQ